MSTATIDVSPLDAPAGRWRVEVRSGTTTSHDVTIPPGYLDTLGVGAVAPERVLEASFRFLLERESNTSILRRFELPVIAQYFPEYEGELRAGMR